MTTWISSAPNARTEDGAWKLLLHLIGGEERAFEIKSAFKDADYKGGMETILKESTLLAVIGR